MYTKKELTEAMLTIRQAIIDYTNNDRWGYSRPKDTANTIVWLLDVLKTILPSVAYDDYTLEEWGRKRCRFCHAELDIEDHEPRCLYIKLKTLNR